MSKLSKENYSKNKQNLKGLKVFEINDDEKNTKKELNIENIPNESEKIAQIYNLFMNERDDITSSITELSKKFNSISTLNELQIELYSRRQMFVDKKSLISDYLNKITRNHKIKKEECFINLKTNSDLYIKNNSDIKMLIDSSLSEIEERINLYTNHIDFLQETINTIDRMIFGIKYRLQIYELTEKDI